MDFPGIFLQVAAGVMIFTGVFVGVYYAGQFLVQWYSAYEGQYVEKTGEDLYGMFMNMPPQRLLQASIFCFLFVFFLSLILLGTFTTVFYATVSLSACTMLAFGAALIPRMILRRAAKQRLKLFDLQLLDALLSMSNALKAGFSILQAFESVIQERRNPIAQEFELFIREVRLGVKFDVASDNLMKRVPSEDLQIVLTGIETARQTGGNLTEVFDRLAGVIRERMRVQGRIQSLTAQGRLQGWVVAAVPFFMGFAFYVKQPEMMSAFLVSPQGIICICVVLVLEMAGVLLIRKIVNIDV